MENTPVVNNVKNFITIASGNFLFFSDFLDEIYEIFTSKYYIGEFLINLFFILLVMIISVILYWDNINNKVSSNSRCKRQMDVIDKAKGAYVIDAYDKNNNKLFDISYVLGAKRVSVDCKCKEGDVVNNFRNITVRDLKSAKDTILDKKCMCDQFYDTGVTNQEIIYKGEQEIIKYMDTKDTTFFDNYYNKQY